MYRILSLLSVIMATYAMDNMYSAPMLGGKRHENMTITFHRDVKCNKDKRNDKSYRIAEGSCHAVPGESHLWYIAHCEDQKDSFSFCSDKACSNCQTITFANSMCIDLDNDRSHYGIKDKHRSDSVYGATKYHTSESKHHDFSPYTEKKINDNDDYVKVLKKPEILNITEKATIVEISVSAVCKLIETKHVTKIVKQQVTKSEEFISKRVIKPNFASVSIQCPAVVVPKETTKPYTVPKDDYKPPSKYTTAPEYSGVRGNKPTTEMKY